MKALVVDDNLEMRMMNEMILRDHGFSTVMQASNGKEALAVLEKADLKFSLLLTDFNMPLMNGKELIEETFRKGIQIEKIIVMSGLMGNEDLLIELLCAYPHIKFFQKPSSITKLIALLEE